jgi:hypothetical protein
MVCFLMHGTHHTLQAGLILFRWASFLWQCGQRQRGMLLVKEGIDTIPTPPRYSHGY